MNVVASLSSADRRIMMGRFVKRQIELNDVFELVKQTTRSVPIRKGLPGSSKVMWKGGGTGSDECAVTCW